MSANKVTAGRQSAAKIKKKNKEWKNEKMVNDKKRTI